MGTRFKSFASALLLLMCLTHHYQAQVTQCNNLDIVFVLDGSASLHPLEWATVRNIMEQSLATLDIAPDRIYAGFVVFSTVVTYTSPQLIGNKQELLSVVKTLQHPNGGTFTNLAIDAAVDLLAKSRPASEAPDAIVIVTDGATETEAETAASVQRAKNAGIAIFAIGIGQSIQQSDLLKLADANRVVNAGNIANLLQTLIDITKQACKEVTTTTAAPTTTTTTPAPPTNSTPDVCADAKKVDNLTGFVYHPTDCDKFIQCHFYDNNTVAVYRTCPLGQYWNHAFLRCDEACDVDCPYEKCHTAELESHKMEGSCRAFWRCQGFKSVPACCPKGYRYTQGHGCVEDPACQDFCGHMQLLQGKGVCKEKRERTPVVMYSRDQVSHPAINSRDWHLKAWFHKYWTDFWSSDVEWCTEPEHNPYCDTDRFDLVTCRCAVQKVLQKADQCRPELDLNFANATQLSSVPSDAYDLRSVTLNPEFASFPGTFGSLLHLAVEDRYGRPLAFSLRYREKSAIKEQVALIRSTRCDNEGALYVTLKPDSLTAEISSPTGKYAVTTVSTLGFSSTEWKNVTMVYDGTSLTLSIRNEDLHYVSRVDAPKVRCFTCGVDVAPGSSIESFSGDLEFAQVLYCYPRTVDAK